jgi:hypothetical protein
MGGIKMAFSNEKLAEFITKLGQFNGYGSTVAQTKDALDQKSVKPLRDDNDDRVIFEDIIKALDKISTMPFGVESIIAINSEFDGDSHEQPNEPGRLRDIIIDPARDRIHVDLWPGDDGSDVEYFPPAIIDEEDLQEIVSEWQGSRKQELDAWTMFAKLAKLQPFQDGNKRTALIAINHASGRLESQDYLTPPVGRKYLRFMDALLGYYGVGLLYGPTDEQEALEEFLQLAISKA